VLKFPSRKTESKPESIVYTKDWANAGAEIERLGKQLDAVRGARKMAKRNSWAKKHWGQTEQILLRKWKQTISLHKLGLRQSVKEDPNRHIDYSWWENAEEMPLTFPLLDNLCRMMQDATAGNTNLDRAWEMAREEKLQKARQGLA
jgi:hypothetical protein